MKSEIKEKWIAALTNGKYQQGRDKLRSDDNTYCCLGVLCDLYQKDNPEVSAWMNGEGYYFQCPDEFSSTKIAKMPNYPNTEVFEKYAGMARRQMLQLAGANDSGVKFHEIAEMVKEY
jgi:hypothetical protein